MSCSRPLPSTSLMHTMVRLHLICYAARCVSSRELVRHRRPFSSARSCICIFFFLLLLSCWFVSFFGLRFLLMCCVLLLFLGLICCPFPLSLESPQRDPLSPKHCPRGMMGDAATPIMWLPHDYHLALWARRVKLQRAGRIFELLDAFAKIAKQLPYPTPLFFFFFFFFLQFT